MSTEKESKKLITGRKVVAKYSCQLLEEYQGNPLIEALPPIFDKEAAASMMSAYPKYNSSEREAPPEIRYHYIQRLKRYVQPLDKHLDLERRFSMAIRQGYIDRNPLSPNYAARLQKWYEAVKAGKFELNDLDFEENSGAGFTIIGISGIGKSTAIRRVLHLYPQVVIHSSYKKKALSVHQLVWLKLDCPPDGSLRALCLNFFTALDKILETSYSKQYGSSKRLSAASMLPIMGQLAQTHCLGALIIDEIQHLSQAKSGGAEEMLNFFVTMVNTIGVPVILIGTTKALPILQEEFRQARRGSGQGDMVWERMEKDGYWNLLVQGMWKYQWTATSAPITPELIDVLYEESQGIVDIAVKLYMIAQFRVIALGKKELIIPSVIKQVAKDSLKLVHPMLEALKSGDPERIAQYPDIKPIDIEKYYKDYLSSLNSRLSSPPALSQADILLSQTKLVCNTVILRLLELGVDPTQAKLAAEQVIITTGGDVDLNKAVTYAFQLVLRRSLEEQGAGKKSAASSKRTSKKVETYIEPDLRYYLQKAKALKKPVYQILKEDTRYIREPMAEFLLRQA
jgi:ABC-type oligopeptide transport system ATPase subunit